jgi:hypothetical protein
MLTPEQAAAALDIGRTTVYALIKSGELRSLLITCSISPRVMKACHGPGAQFRD